MDPEPVLRARRGDQRAFEALAVALHPRLFRLAYGILRDATLAEEAVQQAFIDIWRHLRRLRDPGDFAGWSCRFVVDACRVEADRLATQAPEGPADLASPDRLQASIPLLAPGPFSTALDRDQLGRAFGQLDFDHRAALVLAYLLELSSDDIALALRLEPGEVAPRLERALAALGEAHDTAQPAAVGMSIAVEGAR